MARYGEDMPIFSMQRVGENIALSGGGGDPLFGKSNGVVLVDPDYNVLDRFVTDEMVQKMYVDGALVLVQAKNTSTVLRVDGARFRLVRKIEKSITWAALRSGLYYIEKGSIVYEKLRKGDTKMPIVSPGGEPVALFVRAGVLYAVGRKGGKHTVRYGEREHVLDGETGGIASSPAAPDRARPPSGEAPPSALALFTRDGCRTPIRFLEPVPRIVPAEKVTCISTDGQYVVCGTGDGKVSVYCRGSRRETRKVTEFPITSVLNIGDRVYYSSIDGRVEDFAMRKRRRALAAALVLALLAALLALGWRAGLVPVLLGARSE